MQVAPFCNTQISIICNEVDIDDCLPFALA